MNAPEPTPDSAPEPEPTADEIAAVFPREVETPRPIRKQPVRETFLPDIHRLLPQSSDAEQGVLSSILLAPKEVCAYCAEKGMTREWMHVPGHSEIYALLMEMWGADRKIDVITLTQELRDRKKLDQVGGPAFVTDLFTFLPTAANASFYVEILEEKFTLREIIRVCTEYAARSYDEQDEVTRLLDEVEAKILKISRERYQQSTNGCSAKELVMIGIAEIERRMALGAQISGLSTGFRNLDQKTDGLHAQELIVIGASPSVGKSALASQIVDHLAVELRVPCAIFPLEMGRKQLSQRMIFQRSRVNPVNWRLGWPADDDEQQRIVFAADAIARAPIFVEDASDCTIQRVRAQTRRLVTNHGVRVVVIDSLSALHSDTRQGRDNRTREAAECSEGCKEMAKELGITVILIAHIDRKKPRNERPQTSDLRESGKVEMDADAIWFLWEPDFDEENPSRTPDIEVWIPKQRDGDPFVSCRLKLVKEFTRFEEHGKVEPLALPGM